MSCVNYICRLLRSKKGQASTGYIIVGTLIAISAITSVVYYGKDIKESFSGMTGAMAGDEKQEVKCNVSGGGCLGDASKNEDKELSLKDLKDGTKQSNNKSGEKNFTKLGDLPVEKNKDGKSFSKQEIIIKDSSKNIKSIAIGTPKKSDLQPEVKVDGKADGKDLDKDVKPEGKFDGKIDGKDLGKDVKPEGKIDGKVDGKGLGKDVKPEGKIDGKVDGKIDGKDIKPEGNIDGKVDGKDLGKDIKLEGKIDGKVDGKDFGKDIKPEGKIDGKIDGKDLGKDIKLEGKIDGKVDAKDLGKDIKPEGKIDGKVDGTVDALKDPMIKDMKGFEGEKGKMDLERGMGGFKEGKMPGGDFDKGLKDSLGGGGKDGKFTPGDGPSGSKDYNKGFGNKDPKAADGLGGTKNNSGKNDSGKKDSSFGYGSDGKDSNSGKKNNDSGKKDTDTGKKDTGSDSGKKDTDSKDTKEKDTGDKDKESKDKQPGGGCPGEFGGNSNPDPLGLSGNSGRDSGSGGVPGGESIGIDRGTGDRAGSSGSSSTSPDPLINPGSLEGRGYQVAQEGYSELWKRENYAVDPANGSGMLASPAAGSAGFSSGAAAIEEEPMDDVPRP